MQRRLNTFGMIVLIMILLHYKFMFAESRKSELIKENNHMQDIKNEEYVTCPRCEKEVYKDAITCPFCNFGIMAWLEGEINENGEPMKKSSKQKVY